MNRAKVKKNDVFILFFLLVFLKPTVVDVLPELSILNYIYDAARVVLMALVPIYYIIKRQYTVFTIFIVIIYAYLIFITYKTSGDIRTIILTTGNIITVCMYAEISFEKRKERIIVILKYILATYIILNLITLLLFPGGWYISGKVNPQNWLLGNKNLFIMFHLPYLFCVFLLRDHYKKKFSYVDYIGIGSTIIGTLLSQSSTSIVGVAVFILVYLLKAVWKKTLKARTGIVVTGVLFAILIVNDMSYVFSFIIVNILKRNLTLTVRTYVWRQAFAWWSTSPIIGVGIQPTEIAESHMFGYWHPHCTYMYYLVFGGIVCMALFVVLLVILARKIDIMGKEDNHVSVSYIWATLIVWLTDCYSRPELFFIVFVFIGMLAANNKKAITEGKKRRIKRLIKR